MFAVNTYHIAILSSSFPCCAAETHSGMYIVTPLNLIAFARNTFWYMVAFISPIDLPFKGLSPSFQCCFSILFTILVSAESIIAYGSHSYKNMHMRIIPAWIVLIVSFVYCCYCDKPFVYKIFVHKIVNNALILFKWQLIRKSTNKPSCVLGVFSALCLLDCITESLQAQHTLWSFSRVIYPAG